MPRLGSQSARSTSWKPASPTWNCASMTSESTSSNSVVTTALGAYGSGGKFYGMPKEYNLENGGMLVNLKMVKSPPKTWSQLFQMSAKIENGEKSSNPDFSGFVFQAAGELHAISAVCTHQGCELTADAARSRLVCPCHDASFRLDGSPNPGDYRLNPLPSLQVRRNGGDVEVLVAL